MKLSLQKVLLKSTWKTTAHSLKLLFILTLYFLLLMLLEMNSKTLKLNIWSETLAIKSSLCMQLNAFDKSVMKTPKIPLLLTLLFHFSIITIRQSWVLKSFLIPYWGFEKVLSKKQRVHFKLLSFLLKTGFISASVIVDWNHKKGIASLRLEVRNFLKISIFSLVIVNRLWVLKSFFFT